MSTRINKQQLILEFISVVFAVILALILNSWRESSALNNSLSKVEESIQQELRRNDSLVQASYNYRKELLQKIYNNNNLIMAVPTSLLEVDVENNKELTDFFRRSFIISQKQYFNRVEILEDGKDRVLILNESVYDLIIEKDTLKLLGNANIDLGIPDLSNRSWDLAQATGTISVMDVEFVEKLSLVNTMVDTYTTTAESAVQMLYNGNLQGIASVLEDLNSLEFKMMKANQELLKKLE